MKTETLEFKTAAADIFANTSAVIVAGGSSSRMGGQNKLLCEILGVPVIARALGAYQQCRSVGEIIIAARQCDIPDFQKICTEYGISKLSAIVEGGCTRSQSVKNAVDAVSGRFGYIAIADAARPLTSPELIDKVLEQAMRHRAAVCAVPVTDTVKIADKDGFVASTPDRSTLFAAQTPQIFDAALYRSALVQCGGDYTDDCGLIEACGVKVKIVEGDPRNIKITVPSDLAVAQAFLTEGSL